MGRVIQGFRHSQASDPFGPLLPLTRMGSRPHATRGAAPLELTRGAAPLGQRKGFAPLELTLKGFDKQKLKTMDDFIFERMRNILLAKEVVWEEKKMMGGITFMVDDKMCFGTFKGGLLCRVDPEEKEQLLNDTIAEVIRQGGREMKGYVHIQPAGYETDEDLEFWISKCLEFNPKAKSSKKRKKKN